MCTLIFSPENYAKKMSQESILQTTRETKHAQLQRVKCILNPAPAVSTGAISHAIFPLKHNVKTTNCLLSSVPLPFWHGFARQKIYKLAYIRAEGFIRLSIWLHFQHRAQSFILRFVLCRGAKVSSEADLTSLLSKFNSHWARNGLYIYFGYKLQNIYTFLSWLVILCYHFEVMKKTTVLC